MATTVEIISGQSNTVTVKPKSTPTVEVSEKGENKISVKSAVTINVNNITGTFTDVLDESIVVTNEDQGIGNAVGRTYGAGTPLETIVRDILVPSRVPTVSIEIRLRNHKSASLFTDFLSDDIEFMWGAVMSLSDIRITISDPDNLIIADEPIEINNNHFPGPAISFLPTDFGENRWKDLSYPLDISVSNGLIEEREFDYNDLQFMPLRTYTFSVDFKYNREGVKQGSSNECTVSFFKFLTLTFAGDTELLLETHNFQNPNQPFTESDLFGDTPEQAPSHSALVGTVQNPDTGIFTITNPEPTQFSLTTVTKKGAGVYNVVTPSPPIVGFDWVGSGLDPDGSEGIDTTEVLSLYIVIPHNLNINLVDNASILHGVSPVGNRFEFVGYIKAPASNTPQLYPELELPFDIVYKVFRAKQRGAFGRNESLQLTLIDADEPFSYG